MTDDLEKKLREILNRPSRTEAENEGIEMNSYKKKPAAEMLNLNSTVKKKSNMYDIVQSFACMGAVAAGCYCLNPVIVGIGAGTAGISSVVWRTQVASDYNVTPWQFVSNMCLSAVIGAAATYFISDATYMGANSQYKSMLQGPWPIIAMLGTAAGVVGAGMVNSVRDYFDNGD